MKPLTPQQVWDRIEYVRKSRKPLEEDWRDNVRILSARKSGRLPHLAGLEADINLLFSTVRTMVPSLYFKGPDLRVVAENPLGIEAAPLVKAILDYRFRKSRAKQHIKRTITDALCCSWGFLKAGYCLEQTTAEIPPDVEIETPPSVALSLFGSPTHVVLEQGSHSMLTRCSPFTVYFDSNALGPQDEALEWIAQRVMLRKSDLDSPLYKKGAVRLVKAGIHRASESKESIPGPTSLSLFNFDVDRQTGSELGPQRQQGDGQASSGTPDDADKLYAWEFWDMVRARIYVLPEPTHFQGDPVFIRDDEMPYPSHPFFGVVLSVEPPEEPYPTPILSLIKVHQDQLNSIRDFMLDYIKRALPKYAVDTMMVDEQDIEELKQGGPAPICQIKGDVTKAVTVLSAPPLNPDMHVVEAKVRDDSVQTSGIAEFWRGVPVSKETTATEQTILARSVSIVIEENRDRVADFVSDAAGFLVQLEKSYTTKPQVVRIVGSADVEWREWTNEDIQGEFDISVVVGSQLLTDRAVATKQALDAFNLFAPIALQGGPVNFYPLAYNVLETLGFKNIDLILPRERIEKPPQDPYAENELFRAGGMPEAGFNDQDQDHIQVHRTLLETPDLDMRIAWNVGRHMRTHEVQAQQKAQVASQQIVQGLAGAETGPVPGGAGPAFGFGPQAQSPLGRVNSAGVGRQTPAPGQPANPRQFAESEEGQGIADILRVLQR